MQCLNLFATACSSEVVEWLGDGFSNQYSQVRVPCPWVEFES